MKKCVSFVIKAVISISLIWYLLSKTEFTAIYTSIKGAALGWLCLSFLTLYLGKILTSFRWQILLAAQGIQIPLRSLVASVFVGQFFNSFLPTTVGGDAIRAYDTASQSKESTKSVMSVFADRLIGVFALALLAILALGIGYLIGEQVSFYAWPVLGVFAICSLGMFMVYNDKLIVAGEHLLSRMKMSGLVEKLDKAYRSLYLLRERPQVMALALVISILLQINVVLFYYFIGVALDLEVSWLYFTMIVPVALVVLLVPFSINGIGIREGIFVYLLTGLGVPVEESLALSLISFGLMLTQGIIGGVIFAFRGTPILRTESVESASTKSSR